MTKSRWQKGILPQPNSKNAGGTQPSSSGVKMGHTLPSLGLNNEWESPLRRIDDIPFDFISRVDFMPPGVAMAFIGPEANGGAVVITTKKGNEFEPVKLNNHIAYTPLGYQKKAEFYSPAYDTEEALESSTVDLRPTLYWNPDIRTGDDGFAEFSFYTSDSVNAKFTIRIEGMAESGELFQSVQTIESGK